MIFITNSGNVGIGISNPNAKLVVYNGDIIVERETGRRTRITFQRLCK